MSIKSTRVNDESEQKKEYPKLMESDMQIVLFDEPSQGTVLASTGDVYKTGHYSNSWDMSRFEDYNGKIILENE